VPKHPLVRSLAFLVMVSEVIYEYAWMLLQKRLPRCVILITAAAGGLLYSVPQAFPSTLQVGIFWTSIALALAGLYTGFQSVFDLDQVEVQDTSA
jgi:hypothetical protein